MATAVAESLSVSPEKELIDWTKSFVPRLREAQAASDQQARVPDALAEELHDAGVFSLMTPAAYGGIDRKSTRLNSSHERRSRMPSSA